MTDSEPDWANYNANRPCFSAEHESNKRWQQRRTPLEFEPVARRSSDPLLALIDAEDDALGDAFCERFASQIARLDEPLSRDAKRRLIRWLLDELERMELFGKWMSELLRERGISTQTWKRLNC